MGVVLLVVELSRKNKEDEAKKAKEAEEKAMIRDLHERHLAAEKVGGRALGGWGGRAAGGGHQAGAAAVAPGALGCTRQVHVSCVATAPCRLPPAAAAPQELREQLRTLGRQLHSADERLKFMEEKMGRRSWLPLFG